MEKWDAHALREQLLMEIRSQSHRSLLQAIVDPFRRACGERLGCRPPVWLAASFMTLLVLCMGLVLTIVFREGGVSAFALEQMIWISLVGLCTALAAHILCVRLLLTLRDHVIPNLEREKDLIVVKEGIAKIFSLRRQILFVIFSTPMVWFLLFRLTNQAVDAPVVFDVPHLGVFLISALAGAEGAGALYFVIPLLDFLPRMRAFHFRLYELNPRESDVMVFLSAAATEVMWVFVLLNALIAAAMVAMGLLHDRTLLIVLVLLLWLPLIVAYLGAQRTFREIITQAKWRYLGELQSRIRSALQHPDALEKESLEDINRWMDFHSRIASTPNSAVDLGARLHFINGLIMPLIAAALTNYQHLIQLFSSSP